jgi:hypothetical protein
MVVLGRTGSLFAIRTCMSGSNPAVRDVSVGFSSVTGVKCSRSLRDTSAVTSLLTGSNLYVGPWIAANLRTTRSHYEKS